MQQLVLLQTLVVQHQVMALMALVLLAQEAMSLEP